jgi:predicted component of type VI protein secretion system
MQALRAMNAQLLVVIGKTTKRTVALKLPAVLGRSREADITVAHPLISRRHCEIFENEGLLMLRDMASLNGTMIGGRRIELAPLLPDGEFTIGPVTFRVLYEFDGDLESIPDTRFVDAEEETSEAGAGEPVSAELEEVPMLEVDEALPAEPAVASEADELAMPDFMADAVPEEALPAAAAADDSRLTAPVTDGLDEPLEVDSSLQSGGHGRESPWAVGPPAVKKPRHAPPASAGRVPTDFAEEGPPAQPETPPEATSDEEVAQPPAKERTPAARPPKEPDYDDDLDAEFGSFLEGLE